MARVTSMEGTITLSDGTESQFSIGVRYDGPYYMQWGAEVARLGQLADLLDEIASMLADEDWREV